MRKLVACLYVVVYLTLSAILFPKVHLLAATALPHSFLAQVLPPAPHASVIQALQEEDLIAEVRSYLGLNLGKFGVTELRIKMIELLGVLQADLVAIAKKHGKFPSEATMQTKLKTSWRKVLADVRDFRNDRPLIRELPLIHVLLNGQSIAQRTEKFDLFCEMGAFTVTGSSWPDLSYELVFDELVHRGEDDDQSLTRFLHSFLQVDRLYLSIWSEADLEMQKMQKTKWLQRHKEQLLAAFLQKGQVLAAQKLIEVLSEYEVSFFVSFEEKATGVRIDSYLPLLEIILNAMHETLRELEDRSDSKILEEFIAHFLANEPFTRSALQKFAGNELSTQAHLDPQEWHYIQTYCRAGYIRDFFLRSLGAKLHDVLEQRGDAVLGFRGFIQYLSNSEAHFAQLKVYRGFEKLFCEALHDGLNMLQRAAVDHNVFALEKMYALLAKLDLFAFEDKGNQFHLAFSSLGKLQDLSYTEREESCLQVFKFFLYSKLFTREDIVAGLTQKNSEGDTPLTLAGKLGYYKVFRLIKSYLYTFYAFDEDEHARPYQTEFLLLQGMMARRKLETSSELAVEIENLQLRLIKWGRKKRCYAPFNPHTADDAQHMARLERDLEKIFATPVSAKHDPATRIYQPAFQRIYHHLHGIYGGPEKFRRFRQAPFSIQVSFYDGPVRFLIRKILRDHARGCFNAQQVYELMTGRLAVFLPSPLERFMKKLVSDEMTIDKRPKGRWLPN